MEHGDIIASLETLEFFDLFFFKFIGTGHLDGNFDQRLWQS